MQYTVNGSSDLAELKRHISKPPQRQFVNIDEYYIKIGAALNVQCNNGDTSNMSNCIPFQCCATRLHVIDTENLAESRRVKEGYIRLHRVQNQSDGNQSSSSLSGDNHNRNERLAYGDIVYMECGKGHVLRATAITGKIKWDTRKNYDDKKCLKDRKCHFKIVGPYTNGNYLTAGRNFQLESTNWSECYVGGIMPPSTSDTGYLCNFQALYVATKARLEAKNAKVLNFFARPSTFQPPRRISAQRFSVKCSKGYTKVAHRMACRSYLNQSSSGKSTSKYLGLSSSPADFDIIV